MEALGVIESNIGNCESVDVMENYVSEITDGIGIVICSSSVMLSQTLIKKCPRGGLLIKSSC